MPLQYNVPYSNVFPGRCQGVRRPQSPQMRPEGPFFAKKVNYRAFSSRYPAFACRFPFVRKKPRGFVCIFRRFRRMFRFFHNTANRNGFLFLYCVVE